MISLAVVAVVVLVLLIIFGKYPSIFKQGFQDVGAPSMPTFTMFYADWCGHCKKAKPGFVEFMADGKVKVGDTEVKVEMINADSGSPKMKAFNVSGYPSFCLQKTDGKIVEYKGERDAAAYLEFLNQEFGVKTA
jgi:thiol-disulfide isomerase/thioredoxin